jgi:hypothetical protein
MSAKSTGTKSAAKSCSITLRANGSMMTLLALRTESGADVTVTTKKPNEPSERGMSQSFKSFDAAVTHVETLAKDAAKLGWTRGKFQAMRKADAFSSLPKPPAVVAAVAAE